MSPGLREFWDPMLPTLTDVLRGIRVIFVESTANLAIKLIKRWRIFLDLTISFFLHLPHLLAVLLYIKGIQAHTLLKEYKKGMQA
jgi:dihydropteroate synthase